MFYGYARKRDRAFTQLVAVRKAAEDRKYRILACVGNPRRAEVVLQAAATVARHYRGELVALSVVEVPDRDLLAQGIDPARQVKEELERTVAGLQLGGVPVRVVVKVSHRISFGITETALEERCNLIVMGRGRRVGLIARLAATITDRVVRSAPAQVMVVTAERWPEHIGTVLLAYERGPNSELTADLAAAFGGKGQTTVRAVHVLSPTATAAELQSAREAMVRELGSRCRPEDQSVVPAGDVVTGLLRHAGDADVMVIGGTEAGMLEQLLGYAPPLELADRTSRPVLTVYEMPVEPKRWMS